MTMNTTSRRRLCTAVHFALYGTALAAVPAFGQQTAAAEEKKTEVGERVVITGSRLPSSLSAMPQSVQIIDFEEISKQAALTTNLSEILAELVPGISRSTNTAVNTYTAIRGRKPIVLIDGAPITSTLNDTARELLLIDPDTIQRIEVVPGSSALYGNSAGAGFINYVTRRGDPGPANFRTELGADASLTKITGRGTSPLVRQSASGTVGAVDYRVTGMLQRINDYFDADGNVIPPQLGSALQDSDVKSFFGKGGYSVGRQRIEGSISYYSQEADIKWAVRNGDISQRIPASAIPAVPQPGQIPEEHKATVTNLVYSNAGIFNTSSSFRAQAYYLDTESWFQYAVNRFPLFPDMPNGQSGNRTKKTGARFDVNTPLRSLLPLDGTILWGVDLLRDDTKIPLVDGRQFGIPQVLKSVAEFVQVQMSPFQWLKLNAGIRHEASDLDVSDYLSVFTRAQITGGTLKFNTTPKNAGAVVSLTNSLDAYAGWSQGFDIQQTSQNFRAWPVDINLAQTKPPANVIDSYEVGLRFRTQDFRGSVGVYEIKSSNGVSYVFNSAAPNEPRALVAPDRVRGIEATLDYTGIERWNFGMTYARSKGDADTNNDGSYDTPLQNRRIPPPSVTAHAEYELSPGSFIRLQGLWSGDRNAFPNTVPGRFHEGHVHSYYVFDVIGRFNILKNADLTVGVKNLFNRDYFTNYSEGFNTNDNYLKAPGRTLSVRVGFNY